MHKQVGLRRIHSALVNNHVVRFFVRDAFGRFSSLKYVVYPKPFPAPFTNAVRSAGVYGDLVYVIHRGTVIKPQTTIAVGKNSINWATVRVKE